MIEGRTILALIPARGGSKGIINKNIVNLCGKPLIGYTCEAAKKSRYIDDIILSTDSLKIAEIALSYNIEVPFMRPAELAQDDSETIDAVMHAIQALKKIGRIYDILVLLQPTHPLRTTSDIDQALQKYMQQETDSLVSVSLVKDNPILVRTINKDDKLIPLLDHQSTIRRQDMPSFYKVNGCIYINEVSEIDSHTSFNDNKVSFIMELSHSIDIDEMVDLTVAEYYIKKRGICYD